MEIMIFSTRVPQEGQIGAWLPLKRRANGSPSKLSVTAFRPYNVEQRGIQPISGEIEWICGLDQTDRNERFSSGTVDVVLGADTPCLRIRFRGEGPDGGNLRVMVQFNDIDAA
jgi:hypothetical protein